LRWDHVVGKSGGEVMPKKHMEGVGPDLARELAKNGPVFTPDEVVNLDHYQRSEQQWAKQPMHPFTCPNRGNGQHRTMGGDLGALIPTVRGWICPFCDYTQDWAHDFMKGDAGTSTLK
jgi:hypothetical protein